MAPIGMPLASALASEKASGRMPCFCQANQLPVRPMPHWTSSQSRSRFFSSQRARSPRMNSVVAGTRPPSPCTGSRMTATVRSPISALTDSRSLNSAKAKPTGRGSKPFWILLCPVAAQVASVRPWKELRMAMIS